MDKILEIITEEEISGIEKWIKISTVPLVAISRCPFSDIAVHNCSRICPVLFPECRRPNKYVKCPCAIFPVSDVRKIAKKLVSRYKSKSISFVLPALPTL